MATCYYYYYTEYSAHTRILHEEDGDYAVNVHEVNKQRSKQVKKKEKRK